MESGVQDFTKCMYWVYNFVFALLFGKSHVLFLLLASVVVSKFTVKKKRI